MHLGLRLCWRRMEAEGKADVEKQREAAEKFGQEVDELQVHITA